MESAIHTSSFWWIKRTCQESGSCLCAIWKYIDSRSSELQRTKEGQSCFLGDLCPAGKSELDLSVVWGQIWIKQAEMPARLVVFSTYLREGRGWCHWDRCGIKSRCCEWHLSPRLHSCLWRLKHIYSFEECHKLLNGCFITLSQSSTPPWFLKQENFPPTSLVQRARLLQGVNLHFCKSCAWAERAETLKRSHLGSRRGVITAITWLTIW